MATWKLSPTYKKSIEERSTWSKDTPNGSLEFLQTVTYRWGECLIESDDEPEIDLSNPDGIDVTLIDDAQIDSLDDQVSEYWTDPDDDDIDTDDIDADYMEENGFEIVDVSIWFFGELTLEKV
jgi:hypothetical protein